MIAALLAVAAASALTGGDRDWATDAQGRSFRVGFDPASVYYFDGGYTYDDGSRATLGLGWLIRSEDAESARTWKLTHALFTGAATVGGGTARFDALVYRGEYLRWSKDGGIVIPTIPPTRLSFPIDIGFSLELGRLRTRPESDAFQAEVGVVGSEILFDFWRSRHVGSYLVLGVGPSYDVWLQADDKALHVVTPFSRARLTLHHEWCLGKQVFELTAEAGTAWTSKDRWTDHAGAGLSYQWTFLALNDNPLSLRLAGSWRWDELLADEAHDGHELTATAGLRLGL
ncbi:MAG: hypothetical protein U1F43_01375 [Myxococcota bacterium]